MAGTDMPAISAIPTGAPTIVPSCHINFFFLNHKLFFIIVTQPLKKGPVTILTAKARFLLRSQPKFTCSKVSSPRKCTRTGTSSADQRSPRNQSIHLFERKTSR